MKDVKNAIDNMKNVKNAIDNMTDGIGIAKRVLAGEISPTLQEGTLLNLVHNFETQVKATFMNLKSIYDQALPLKPQVCEQIEADMKGVEKPLVSVQLSILDAQAKLQEIQQQFHIIIEKALGRMKE